MISSSSPPIYCLNPDCSEPRNLLGHQNCQACQTPLVYRYLWAVGPEAAQIPPGEVAGGRYYVIGPQLWLDTQPGRPPMAPEEPPDEWLPYLYLYLHRLHTPEIYGVCLLEDDPKIIEIILLENVPIDSAGQLMPALEEVWASTSPLRQVYWLWQISQLWMLLLEQGVASSLLSTQNLRVDTWRLRLLELLPDRHEPRLRDLEALWSSWMPEAHPTVKPRLEEICRTLGRSSGEMADVSAQLNQLLLEQVAQQPFSLEVVGATDTGPTRSHNEDNCYPTQHDLEAPGTGAADPLIHHLMIVCDGVGGHDGGEIASQMAVQSLKPMIQTLLSEASQPGELMQPEMVKQHLVETIRVVNNLIASQNDQQGKEMRQRMATTLVMALQLPQTVDLGEGSAAKQSHELYLANVGDSRAYWLTADACQQLTVDDDVASREVRLGRSLYWQALYRPDSGALTQALGTRDAEFLYPTIQRFIVDEDGVLLLCSDGLSDHNWIERSWENYAPAILKGEMSLQTALESWMTLTNSNNGHDNTSMVLAHCRVSTPPLKLMDSAPITLPQPPLESELSEASKALLYGEAETVPRKAPRQPLNPLPVLGLLALLLIGGVALWAMNQAVKLKPQPPLETLPSAPPNPPQGEMPQTQPTASPQ